jgi:hypothetical protein
MEWFAVENFALRAVTTLNNADQGLFAVITNVLLVVRVMTNACLE